MAYNPNYKKPKDKPKKISGVAFFARVQTPQDEKKLDNGKTIPQRFSVQVGLSNPLAVKQAEEEGLYIKAPNDKIPYKHVEFTRLYKGEQSKPKVTQDGYDFSGLIGNGSKVSVTYLQNKTEQGKVFPVLLEVDITNLIEVPKEFLGSSKQTQMTEEPKKAVKGSKKEAPVDDEIDDEIPF